MTLNYENETDTLLDLQPESEETLAERVIEAGLEDVDCPYDAQVSLLITDDEGIRELNRQFRGIDAPTDVLSFPMREGEDPEIAKQLPLGDIAISIPTAMRYVENCHHKDRINENEMAPLTNTWSLLDELTFLIIHGTLHCLGYDHAEPEEEKIMRAKEKEWMMKVLEG